MYGQRTLNQQWWGKKVKQYGAIYFASSPRVPHPRCEKVDHLFSCGFGPPIRYYAFRDRARLDAFLSQHPQCSECKDPVT